MPINIQPLITVIIPTYRRPILLQRAIKSVLRQTYPHLNVCVYDNASGDQTPDIVKAMADEDPRISYHCHSENIGPYKNFKSGMQEVDTPFFSFLSDDDVLLPEFLEMGLKSLAQYPDAMFSAAATVVMTTQREVIDIPLLSWPHDGIYYPPEGAFEMIGKHLTWTSILFRKEIINEIGLLDCKIGGPMDFDYELRTASRFPIVISKQASAIFFSHASSESGRADLNHFWPSWETIVEKICTDKTLDEVSRKQIKSVMDDFFCKVMIRMVFKSIIEGERSEVFKITEVISSYLHRDTLAIFLRLITWLSYAPGVSKLIKWLVEASRKVNRSRKRKRESWSNYNYDDYLDSLER